MAAFSYHYHPFLVDSSSSFFPNDNNTNSITTPCSSSFEEQAHIIITTNQDTTSCCVDQSSSKVTTEYPSPNFVTQNHQSPETSMVVDKLETAGDDHEQVTQKVVTAPPTDSNNKKRKTTNGSSLITSPLSKDSITEGRSKKQKKSNSIGGGVNKEEKKEKKKGAEEAPTGYIHVRARRGQATDSHSLAERVRREKISERMKVLQRLVPGCDKVTGKALVLDEIINYVQSLQNQVEFLSMKLASLNPLFLDLAMDMDSLFVRPEPEPEQDQKLNSIPSSSSVPQQCSPNLATTTAMTTTTTANDYYLLDYSSSPLLFLQGQRSNVFSEYGQVWDLEGQRQKLPPHPYGFGNNLCSLN